MGSFLSISHATLNNPNKRRFATLDGLSPALPLLTGRAPLCSGLFSQAHFLRLHRTHACWPLAYLKASSVSCAHFRSFCLRTNPGVLLLTSCILSMFTSSAQKVLCLLQELRLICFVLLGAGLLGDPRKQEPLVQFLTYLTPCS